MVTVNGMSGGSMLRVLGAARKRDVKATKNLSIIVLFFIICWFPLYTINFVQAFCKECSVSEYVLNSCIILSHLNSAGNPLLYAYHLTDFRAALRALLFGGTSEGRDHSAYIHDNDSKRIAKSQLVYQLPAPTPKLPHRIYELPSVEPLPELPGIEHPTALFRIINGPSLLEGKRDLESLPSIDSNLDYIDEPSRDLTEVDEATDNEKCGVLEPT